MFSFTGEAGASPPPIGCSCSGFDAMFSLLTVFKVGVRVMGRTEFSRSLLGSLYS